jgi:hypothetical protein
LVKANSGVGVSATGQDATVKNSSALAATTFKLFVVAEAGASAEKT